MATANGRRAAAGRGPGEAARRGGGETEERRCARQGSGQSAGSDAEGRKQRHKSCTPVCAAATDTWDPTPTAADRGFPRDHLAVIRAHWATRDSGLFFIFFRAATTTTRFPLLPGLGAGLRSPGKRPTGGGKSRSRPAASGSAAVRLYLPISPRAVFPCVRGCSARCRSVVGGVRLRLDINSFPNTIRGHIAPHMTPTRLGGTS